MRSDLIALWQTVLWADGYLRRGDIDCLYAGETLQAHPHVAEQPELGADGIVVPQTLTRAGEQLGESDGEIHYEGQSTRCRSGEPRTAATWWRTTDRTNPCAATGRRSRCALPPGGDGQ